MYHFVGDKIIYRFHDFNLIQAHRDAKKEVKLKDHHPLFEAFLFFKIYQAAPSEWIMAFSLLQTMRPQPDIISFNACLGASATLQPWSECLHLVELMKIQLIQPDTWRSDRRVETEHVASEFFCVYDF